MWEKLLFFTKLQKKFHVGQKALAINMSLSEGDISNNKIISTLIKKRSFIYSGLDRSFDCSSFIFIRSLSLIVISGGNGDFDLFLLCWCVCSRRINHQSSIGNVLDIVSSTILKAGKTDRFEMFRKSYFITCSQVPAPYLVLYHPFCG